MHGATKHCNNTKIMIKMAKYSDLADQYTYSVAVETLGPFNKTAYKLVGDHD